MSCGYPNTVCYYCGEICKSAPNMWCSEECRENHLSALMQITSANRVREAIEQQKESKKLDRE